MPVIVRPLRDGEEEYVASLHQSVYAEEYHWGPEFADYAAEIARSFAAVHHTEKEAFWIAELSDSPAGSVMLCSTDEENTGQLRLFIVEKSCRRKGIGTALLDTFMNYARRVGYKKLILWTASPLTDAIRLYERLGFRETERMPNTSWSLDGETVYEIKMEMPLE